MSPEAPDPNPPEGDSPHQNTFNLKANEVEPLTQDKAPQPADEGHPGRRLGGADARRGISAARENETSAAVGYEPVNRQRALEYIEKIKADKANRANQNEEETPDNQSGH